MGAKRRSLTMIEKPQNPCLIGVLSDTHGYADRVGRAARLFAERGVRRLFHCGDIGGESVADALTGFKATYVAGNVDWDFAALNTHIQAADSELNALWAEATVCGKRLALTHGHNGALLNSLIVGGHYDYVFHGHTHTFRDERVGTTRVVNPGALHGVRAHSVAVIDLTADTVERILVPSS